MKTLYRVEIDMKPSVHFPDAEPICVHMLSSSRRMPVEGERFKVTDEWGRVHGGVIVEIEDHGVADAADLLADEEAAHEAGAQCRVIHIKLDPRATLFS